ncbi:GTP-binding DUF697 domain-containing protein [Tabrizicola sp. J26]|uniref:YcjF family protein n=1 Tax=Alitabrizicola rongguiensis TaxID=2909234 RepID=UPI001F23A998|nr:GTPase [Tabrizicola rongguiensis]MCF1708712.1 GTP-binding DUF697 domain-containing protein [Tabrizicola rongguiensis]
MAGAISWGVMRAWRSYSGSRVEAVPKFINTPIDLLAASLFDLIAGLSVLIQREAGALDQAELGAIAEYFTSEWGIAPDYIDAALPIIEESISGRSITEAAKALSSYKRQNPDCDYDAMSAEVLRFLTEIAEVDGHVNSIEKASIAEVGRVFADENGWRFWGAVSDAAGAVVDAPKALWNEAKDWIWSASPDDRPSPKAVGETCLPVPTLWLLGKTGAGKSSLVQALTRLDGAAIGNGFNPCTRTARSFDFPPNEPVMRFLDTRGLGEIDYDPAADLAEIQTTANVVLVVMRLDDPVQGAIVEALRRIRKVSRKQPVIVIHTGADLISDVSARGRAQAHNQKAIESVFGANLPMVTLDLSNPVKADLEPFSKELVEILPSVVMFLAGETSSDEEGSEFGRNRALVLGYAGSATAAGALPLVGAASVPTLQVAMLSALAGRYGVEWSASRLAQLGAALGAGVLGGQALAFAAREGAKLVPVIGQTVAPVAGATWGFTSTWALGRVAAWWFYHLREGNPIDEAELRRRFSDAMRGAAHDPA